MRPEGRVLDLDLECVASFLILLQEGHYGRAATRLGVSRSALTKRIQRLERQVGVVLLLRDAVGVVGPTSGGARFAARAVPLLAAARAARAAAHADHPALTIRLGVHGRIGDFPERFRGRPFGCRRPGSTVGGHHATSGGRAAGRGLRGA
jgi:DNA-binding transcriptional LysR family regulator